MPKDNTSSTPRRALVLGCGGVAGGAWSIAALHHLEQQLGWDCRDADVLIGTSAGAVLAALLGSGISVAQLLACQQGTSDICDWNHDTDTGGALPPLPGARFTGKQLALKGLRGEVSALTAICGALPAGQFDMRAFRKLVSDAAKGQDWVSHPATWIMAVDTDTGKRIAFGKGGAPDARITDAVCASYGVPFWCPPVHIGTRTYIDGGVASPVSADMLVDSAVEEVIVLAPMASRQPDKPWHPFERIERRVRRYMTSVVDREVSALEKAGKKVIRIEPAADDLKAFGYNMMDPARRTRVLETALTTTRKSVRDALRASSLV
ncbi:patatin-like phospholipase family protein [Alcanivorax sp. DP30]|uniref:patatin-like phospholipase family protein n=1 Tax=Alcanivorax sp. DP30 TaxID=2606217 RepID=UPI00136ED43E|nr:patatin-like phospholipase family protein [Alcanivorax sp. DP30]MZR62394.1 patatin-like phospholipase family protein [Alcanivorax sp. DP30]